MYPIWGSWCLYYLRLVLFIREVLGYYFFKFCFCFILPSFEDSSYMYDKLILFYYLLFWIFILLSPVFYSGPIFSSLILSSPCYCVPWFLIKFLAIYHFCNFLFFLNNLFFLNKSSHSLGKFSILSFISLNIRSRIILKSLSDNSNTWSPSGYVLPFLFMLSDVSCALFLIVLDSIFPKLFEKIS